MSKKKKDDNQEPVNKSRHIQLQQEKGKTRDRQITDLAASGLATNGKLVTDFCTDSFGDLSLNDCMETLKSRGEVVNKGDMSELERLLTSQAIALDTIFSSMALKAKMNVGHYPDTVSKYMNLALRAQSQCRSTVEAISEIKNPRPYIQNNKGHYVQVNNGEQPRSKDELMEQYTRARTGEKPETANKLLEDKTHEQEWLDTRAPEETSGDNKELEAVGAQHRAKDG